MARKQVFELMSNEEFEKMKERERKEKLLESLKATTQSSFTINNVKRPEELEDQPKNKKDDKEKTEKMFQELELAYNIPEEGILDDEKWERMVEDFELLMDPFNDISKNEQYKYRRDDDPDNDEDYYDKRFSKEYSLLHALLGQVDKDSKAVQAKIKELIASKKPGIGKYSVVDLWNTSNSMHTTKLQTIKQIADIKKIASELKFKELKNNPPVNDSIEDAASSYYDSIIKGGRQNFVNAIGGGAGIAAPIASMQQMDSHILTEEEEYVPQHRTITSPLNLNREGYEGDKTEDYSTVYIDNENDGVQVFVQRYDDGELEFCALDANGRNVPDYELPDPTLLDSLTMRPDSSYTFDRYGRKYRIIDFGTDFEEVSIGDLGNDEEDDEYV